MKRKSTKIMLVLSGALLVGCDRQPNYAPRNVAAADDWVEDSQSYTNNYYDPSRGYYHSGSRGWFPYPYNYYDSNRGYYNGGSWSGSAHPNTGIVPTSPRYRSSAVPPNVTTTRPVSSPRVSSPSSGISRGGFGGSSSSAS